jgi:hypothetical protein
MFKAENEHRPSERREVCFDPTTTVQTGALEFACWRPPSSRGAAAAPGRGCKNPRTGERGRNPAPQGRHRVLGDARLTETWQRPRHDDADGKPSAAYGRNQYVGRALLPVAFQTGKSAHPTENSRTLQKLEPLVARDLCRPCGALSLEGSGTRGLAPHGYTISPLRG